MRNRKGGQQITERYKTKKHPGCPGCFNYFTIFNFYFRNTMIITAY